MTIEVELPDGTIAEFPDGTSPQTMEMALARYREPAANNSGFARLISGQPKRRTTA